MTKTLFQTSLQKETALIIKTLLKPQLLKTNIKKKLSTQTRASSPSHISTTSSGGGLHALAQLARQREVTEFTKNI